MLKALREAEEAVYEPLAGMTPRQYQWLSAWQVCRSQRYGQGMTIGTLIHSELWNYLDRQIWEGEEDREKQKAFDIVIKLDEAWRSAELEKIERRQNEKRR